VKNWRVVTVLLLSLALAGSISCNPLGSKKETPQEKTILADVIRKRSRSGKFSYNDKASIEILSSKKGSFMGVELLIGAGGSTREEESPENTEILLVATKGGITAHIHGELHELACGDSIYFKGHLPHYFENKTKRSAKAILIQNPKS